MLKTTLLLSNDWTCNHCRKIARYELTINQTKSFSTTIKFCNTHFSEFKRDFIDQILIGDAEEETEDINEKGVFI
jgi:hypothetical protein